MAFRLEFPNYHYPVLKNVHWADGLINYFLLYSVFLGDAALQAYIYGIFIVTENI